MIRFLLATLAALAPSLVLAQALPSPSYRRVIITGPGSTGDASAMSVKPTGSVVSTPIADLMAQRMLTGGNDLSARNEAGATSLLPFGNTDAKTFLYSHRNNTQPSLLGTQIVVRNTPGSGTFGPGAADFAQFLSSQKDNWATATGTGAIEGELDSLYSVARQGKKGDVAILLGDVAKRRDSLTSLQSDENGGLLGYELGAALVDGSGNRYHEVHSYSPFLESPGGISGGRGYGFHTSAFKGTLFAAYGAQVQSGSGAQFVRLIFLDTTGDPTGGGIVYQVDNLGRAYSGLPAARMTYGYRTSTDGFTVEDQANAVALSVGRVNKITTAVGGLQIGGGTTTVYRNAASVTATIPTLANFAVGNLATVPLAGARPGDMVTAEIISAEIGFAGYRVSGAVAANDNVQLRVQNLNGVTAGNVPVSVTIKAERFQ